MIWNVRVLGSVASLLLSSSSWNVAGRPVLIPVGVPVFAVPPVVKSKSVPVLSTSSFVIVIVPVAMKQNSMWLRSWNFSLVVLTGAWSFVPLVTPLGR